MTFRTLMLLPLMLAACAEPGPTPEEIAAMELDRECGKLYGGLTKVYRDQLYKGGVAEVEFATREDFVKACAESGLDEAQRKCMDPNLGGDEACKKTLEAVKDPVKKLQDVLLGPMQDEKKDEAAEGEAAEGEAAEGEAAEGEAAAE